MSTQTGTKDSGPGTAITEACYIEVITAATATVGIRTFLVGYGQVVADAKSTVEERPSTAGVFVTFIPVYGSEDVPPCSPTQNQQTHLQRVLSI